MLRNVFLSFLSQANAKAVPAEFAAKRIDPAQLKLVAGGLPKGGWMSVDQTESLQLPKGGWN